MMNRLNTISNTFEAALSEIKSLTKDLISMANAKKQSILETLEELNAIRDTLFDLGTLCGDTGAELLLIDETCDTVIGNIDDGLDAFESLPTGSYETFVGFCDDCGAEIYINDNYERVDALNILCGECALRAEEIVDEVIESEVNTNV